MKTLRKFGAFTVVNEVYCTHTHRGSLTTWTNTVRPEAREREEREKGSEQEGWTRERGRNVGEDLRKKQSKVYTGATRVHLHVCPCTYTLTCFRSHVAGLSTHMHPHFHMRPPSKNPFNHTHTAVTRGNPYTRVESRMCEYAPTLS